jgi:hypothetical protein
VLCSNIHHINTSICIFVVEHYASHTHITVLMSLKHFTRITQHIVVLAFKCMLHSHCSAIMSITYTHNGAHVHKAFYYYTTHSGIGIQMHVALSRMYKSARLYPNTSHTHTYTRTHPHTHEHTHIHTNTHTYTRTHTNTQILT